MRKRKTNKENITSSQQSSILNFLQKNNLEIEPPRKSLKFEQEENLLEHDPISSFSQQSGFDSQAFELDQHLPQDEDWMAPFLFEIPGMLEQEQMVDSQHTQITIISEFSTDNELPLKDEEKEDINLNSSTLFDDFKPPEFKEKIETDFIFDQLIIPQQQIKDIKEGGITDKALKLISNQKLEYIEWEMSINSQMAKYGSVVKVSQNQPEVYLFRMLKRWKEGGLVYCWCVLLKEEEIQVILDNQYQSNQNTQNDSIKDFTSQTVSIPEYIPQPDDEEILFAFSFSFTNTRISIDQFIECEQIVGIWPDWSEIQVDLEDYGLCDVNLARKFKANSIY